MKEIIFKCLNEECKFEFKGINKEGVRCPKCDSPIIPFNLNPTKEELSKVISYKELKPTSMTKKKSWKQFRDSGLLWWINMILHTFGWSIVVEIEKDGTIINAYPSRVKYRGFTNEFNTEGYIKVSEFLNKESNNLLEESKE